MWITWNQEKIYQCCLARWLSIAPNTINSLFFLSSRIFPWVCTMAGESVQFSCSVMSNSGTQGLQLTRLSLSFTNSQSLLKQMSIESVMPSNDLILCCPLLLLPSTFPSITVFANNSVLCIKWPNCWSFSQNIGPSNEYFLISFKMHWLDLLAVQGTLKSLLQRHSSKTSIL